MVVCGYIRKTIGLGVCTETDHASTLPPIYIPVKVFGFTVLIALEILPNLFSLDLQNYNFVVVVFLRHGFSV